MDARFRAIEESVKAAMAASDKAVDKAETNLTKRLDSMNEFRSSLNDILNRAASKVEVEALRDKIGDMRVQIGVTAALVSLVVSAVMAWLIRR